MKKYVFSRDTILKEMANLSPEKTGIDHGTIYVSSEEGNHGPRVKFYRGKPSSHNPSASISISKTPEVVEDSIGIKSSEIKDVFSFVIANKKRLLYMWYHGSEMMDDVWDKHKKSLKKING